MLIDSHLHVWSTAPQTYPRAGKGTTEVGTAELLLTTMEKSGVSKACIVQPIHYLYDNSYIADVMKRYPRTFSAIAIMDRQRPDGPEELERLVKEDGFEGLRMHLSRPDDPDEWAAKDQYPIWDKAAELGASFLSFGPAELQSYPNVYVKFTPQAGKANEDYPLADTHHIYERIYDTFGPQRLMWGTDFPHIFRNIGYQNGLDLFREHLPFLTSEDQEWLFSKTALSIWKFGET